MRKFIASVLLLCLVFATITSCHTTEPTNDTNADGTTEPTDSTTEPTNDTTEPTNDTLLPKDTTVPPTPSEYLFVNGDGYICINHHYGPRDGYALLTTPAVYDGDTADLEKDVRVWGELSGEHLVVLVYEKTPEIMDVSARRVTVHTTKDMGKSWASSELVFPPPSSEEYGIVKMEIRMADDTRETKGSITLGTNYGKVFFYITEDGGETWQMRTEITHPDAMHTGGITYDDFCFISFESRAGKGIDVFMSVDGGYSWRLMDIPTPDGYSDDGAYVDVIWKWNGVITLEAVYYTMIDGIAGEVRRNYVSSDGAKTWEWEP